MAEGGFLWVPKICVWREEDGIASGNLGQDWGDKEMKRNVCSLLRLVGVCEGEGTSQIRRYRDHGSRLEGEPCGEYSWEICNE